MDGFAKIYQRIFDGTLRENWKALVTFEQLLILGWPSGVVDMTSAALHFRTGIPLDIIEEGLTVLLKADPQSRSGAEEGRRIVPVEEGRAWGWRIVNFPQYRDMRSQEERRTYQREYQRDRRADARVDAAFESRPGDAISTGFRTVPGVVRDDAVRDDRAARLVDKVAREQGWTDTPEFDKADPGAPLGNAPRSGGDVNTCQHPSTKVVQQEAEGDQDLRPAASQLPGSGDVENPVEKEPVRILLMARGSAAVAIEEDALSRYRQAYPRIGVEREVRMMAGFLLGNPEKRPSMAGMEAFIGRWFARCEASRSGRVVVARRGRRR